MLPNQRRLPPPLADRRHHHRARHPGRGPDLQPRRGLGYQPVAPGLGEGKNSTPSRGTSQTQWLRARLRRRSVTSNRSRVATTARGSSRRAPLIMGSTPRDQTGQTGSLTMSQSRPDNRRAGGSTPPRTLASHAFNAASGPSPAPCPAASRSPNQQQRQPSQNHQGNPSQHHLPRHSRSLRLPTHEGPTLARPVADHANRPRLIPPFSTGPPRRLSGQALPEAARPAR